MAIFDQNIPLPSDEYKISQGDLLDNFTNIYDVTLINHSTLNTVTVANANQGKHTRVQFPNQNVVPPNNPPSTNANEAAVYSAPAFGQPLEGVGNGQLYFRRESNNANPYSFTDVQTLNVSFNDTPIPQLNVMEYYSNRLPSGLLIKMWFVNLTVNTGSATITQNIFNYALFTDLPNKGVPFTSALWGTITPMRNIYIDPRGSNGDPNVVFYVSSISATELRFSAITRNLSGVARQGPKRTLSARILVMGT